VKKLDDERLHFRFLCVLYIGKPFYVGTIPQDTKYGARIYSPLYAAQDWGGLHCHPFLCNSWL